MAHVCKHLSNFYIQILSQQRKLKLDLADVKGGNDEECYIVNLDILQSIVEFN